MTLPRQIEKRDLAQQREHALLLAEQATGYILGADEYLIKPFDREVLLDTLRRVVEQRDGGA